MRFGTRQYKASKYLLRTDVVLMFRVQLGALRGLLAEVG